MSLIKRKLEQNIKGAMSIKVEEVSEDQHHCGKHDTFKDKN
jgi:hypothetical protein